jgi:exodeoxyribonuclease VII small subunit
LKDSIENEKGTLTVVPVSKTKKDLTFEEALKNLEAIIEELETGDVPLADLVDQYEKGTALLKTCNERLDEAELKIEKLREKSEQPEFENFDPDD